MALIECPECKKKISEAAGNCPKCGYQLTAEEAAEIKEKEQQAKRTGAIGCLSIIGLVLIYVIGTVLSSDSPSSSNLPAGTKVTKSEYGDRWPFTVDSGYVDCVNPNRAVFRTGGEVYGLNGIAKSAGFRDVRPIWRDDPTGTMPKVNIGSMIQLALAQCK